MQNDFDNWRIVTSACVISAIGATFYNILPIFVGSLQDSMQLSHSQTGIIPSAFYLGFGSVAASAYFWIRRVNWKHLGFGTIVGSVVALLLMGISDSYFSLISGIFLVGICFGVFYALGSTILGDSANPARYFGFKIGMEMIVGVALLFALPVLVIQRWGFSGVVYTLALVVIILGMAGLWVPEKGLKGSHEPESDSATSPESVWPVWCSLFALLFFFGGMSAVWTFVERMAVVAGLAAAAIGKILAISLFVGISGAIGAAFLGKQKGTLSPLLTGLSFCLIGALSFAFDISELSYLLSTCLFGTAFAFSIPFLLTLTSDLDHNGQFIVLTVPAISLGIIVFPAISGLLVNRDSYLGVILFAACSILAAAILSVVSVKGSFNQGGDKR